MFVDFDSLLSFYEFHFQFLLIDIITSKYIFSTQNFIIPNFKYLFLFQMRDECINISWIKFHLNHSQNLISNFLLNFRSILSLSELTGGLNDSIWVVQDLSQNLDVEQQKRNFIMKYLTRWMSSNGVNVHPQFFLIIFLLLGSFLTFPAASSLENHEPTSRKIISTFSKHEEDETEYFGIVRISQTAWMSKIDNLTSFARHETHTMSRCCVWYLGNLSYLRLSPTRRDKVNFPSLENFTQQFLTQTKTCRIPPNKRKSNKILKL